MVVIDPYIIIITAIINIFNVLYMLLIIKTSITNHFSSTFSSQLCTTHTVTPFNDQQRAQDQANEGTQLREEVAARSLVRGKTLLHTALIITLLSFYTVTSAPVYCCFLFYHVTFR